MQTEHKLDVIVKGFKGKKILQIHLKEHFLDDICIHKSTPFFSGMSSTTQKHNRNLEPFFLSERPHASRDRELVQHHNVYAEMKAADPKYCTGRIMAIKKGVNHSNNKERCSAGNLDDLL